MSETEHDQDFSLLSERIANTVAREDKRRRSILTLFILLTLVPIAIGAYIFMRGKDESGWIQKTAQQTASQEIMSIRPLIDQTRELSEELPEIRRLSEQLPQQQQLLTSVQNKQDAQANELETFRPQIQQLTKQLPDQELRLSTLEQRQDSNVALLQRQWEESLNEIRKQNTTNLKRLEERLKAAPTIDPGFARELREIRKQLDTQNKMITQISAEQRSFASRIGQNTDKLNELDRRLEIRRIEPSVITPR